MDGRSALMWFVNLLASAATNYATSDNMLGAGIVSILAVILFTSVWHRGRRKEGKPGVQTWHFIVVGIAGVWLFMSLALGAAAVWFYRTKAIAETPPITMPTAAVFSRDTGSLVTDLASKIEALQISFDVYIKPRGITPEQGKTIVDFLLPRAHFPVDVFAYDANDEEAVEYAAQIANVLRRAEWDVSNPPSDGRRVNKGTTVFTIMGANSKGSPKSAQLLMEAFGAARVWVAGSNTTDPTKPDDKTTIIVGRRPLKMPHPTEIIKSAQERLQRVQQQYGTGNEKN